ITGAGGSARFTWAYRADGAGAATFAVGAAGVDRNTRAPVSAALVSVPLLVGPPALLSLTVTGGRDLVPGQAFTLTVAVLNPGATPIVQSGFAAALNGAAGWLTVVAVSPPVPRRYEPCSACALGGEDGCCRLEYVLTLRLAAEAPLGAGTIAVTASGADVLGLPVISAAAPFAVRVFPGVSKLAAVADNPFHPARGTPADVTFVVAPAQSDGPVSLRIYTLGGELVRSLVDETLAAGVWHAAWDGRNDAGQRVASGLYLLLYQARGVRDVVRLAVIK
ncbi:MAG: FlgD immunoglobulin-like domain containing protein, partial [bacterium]